MTCPPSRFHVPPRTRSAGSSRVQPRGCRVRNPSETLCQTAFRFLPADVFCVSSTSLLLLLQTKAHIHTTQVKAPPLCSQLWAASECPPVLFKHASLFPDCPLLASMQGACSCCLTWVWCLQHCFVFFCFFSRSHTLDPQPSGYDECSTTSDKTKFEFATFSFVILCVQCLFSYLRPFGAHSPLHCVF